MASGGFSRTLEGGQEPFYDFSCSLCTVEGRHVEAVEYCEECVVYLCDHCIKKHNVFPLNKRHRMVQQDQFATAGLSALMSCPTTRCMSHPGEMVNMFCEIHDVVCCSVCKALDHSSCVGTQYILDAAKGIQKTQEYKRVMKETKAFIADIDKVLGSRKMDKSRIAKEKQHVERTIEYFRRRMNKYLDDLETKSRNELDSKETLIVQKRDKDLRDLDSMRTKAGDILKKLESFKGDNECELFVHVKDGKLMMNYAKEKCAGFSRTVNSESIDFNIDPKIEAIMESVDMLGTFSSLQQTAPVPYGRFNINEASDGSMCDINDICQLLDGTILVTDYINNKLKRLDQSYTVLDSVQLPSEPYSVCAIGPDEVAVSLVNDNKIQDVYVGTKLTLTKSFTVGNYYRGIVFMGGNLYVCCGNIQHASSGRIEIYNKARHYIPRSRSRLSSVPLYITASDDGQHLFVTSYKSNDITMLDLAGNVINTFSDKDLDTPRGMCTDGRGHVFVCGLNSSTVLQLSPGQQTIEVIMRETDGIKYPQTVCYDRKTSRLLVGCNKSNNLSVFKLR